MKKLTNENFIQKAKEIHGNKYDYSLVKYINSKTKVKIICNEHNIIFEQTPSKHLSGFGCRLCSGKLLNSQLFINKANKIHNNYYDYSLVNYINSKSKVIILCPIHGEFNQLPSEHLTGKGCPKCNGKHLSINNIIEKANKIHNYKYQYNNVIYTGIKEPVSIICPIHNEFTQTFDSHLMGHGCPKCANKTVDTPFFIEKAIKVHGNKYDYSLVEYVNSKTKVKIICNEHGIFNQSPDKHLQGQSCPKCTKSNISKSEKDIGEFITSLKVDVELSNKQILNGKEIDIYLPNYKIGIEFDGLYFHSEIFKDKNYHLNKTLKCQKMGIRLIHIFEDEWLHKNSIVKSRIKNILGLTEKKIYARKCVIKEVSSKQSRIFLDENHLQGYTNSSIRIGLYYDNELVSVMLFNKPRSGIGGKFNGYELTRFANKKDLIVIGGASKLLSFFEKTYKPKEIRSYADLRWSDGGLYNTLNFNLSHINKPNYWYITNNYNREHRFKFRKHKLSDLGYDTKNKTEREIMLERNIYRIYDCGTLSYKKILY